LKREKTCNGFFQTTKSMYKRLILKRGKKKSYRRFLKGKLRNLAKYKHILTFLEKRERFAVTTIILTSGVLTIQLIWQDVRFYLVLFLAFISYLLTAWSLKEDIKSNEWILLFILPVFFTASVSLFYFLLPPRWIIRLTTTTMFALGTYAILLVENIYNVAVERSIQLLRAAQSVGLLVSLAVIFLTSNIIYSLRLPFWANMLIMTIISFFLAMQSLWSVNLEKHFNKELYLYSLIIAVGVGELSMALSFWPIENASFSLFLSASYYSLVGVVQQHILERLFINVIREYIIVFILTFILAFVITKWG